MRSPVEMEYPAGEEIVDAVRSRLIAYNIESSGIGESEEVALRILDDSGEMLAGIVGWFWGEVLEVEYLWVDKAARGQGLGSALLEKLEAFGREQGCRRAVLTTMSFQAPDFYLRRGY